VYYCCADSQQCGGVYACGNLHDCACTTPQVPADGVMLKETVTVYSDHSAFPMVATETEFSMRLKDRELVTRSVATSDLDAERACVLRTVRLNASVSPVRITSYAATCKPQ
jgi:hypothetical protein